MIWRKILSVEDVTIEKLYQVMSVWRVSLVNYYTFSRISQLNRFRHQQQASICSGYPIAYTTRETSQRARRTNCPYQSFSHGPWTSKWHHSQCKTSGRLDLSLMFSSLLTVYFRMKNSLFMHLCLNWNRSPVRRHPFNQLGKRRKDPKVQIHSAWKRRNLRIVHSLAKHQRPKRFLQDRRESLNKSLSTTCAYMMMIQLRSTNVERKVTRTLIVL